MTAVPPSFFLTDRPNGFERLGHQNSESTAGRNCLIFFASNLRRTLSPTKAVLNIRALGSPSLWIDDRLILQADPALTETKSARTIDIGPMLTPGPHELRFQVERTNGYPLLLAFCEPLKLFTSEKWETSLDGKYWTRCLERHQKPTGRDFPQFSAGRSSLAFAMVDFLARVSVRIRLGNASLLRR